MTPKEKAQELYDKYLHSLRDAVEIDKEVVYQCALIAVDEIIKEVPTEILDTYAGETNFVINDRFGYWQQVRQEIEKL